MKTKLLKGMEVAEILNISKAYAYRLMAKGQIPTVRFGRTVRVRPEDLDAFIERNDSMRNTFVFGSGFPVDLWKKNDGEVRHD